MPEKVINLGKQLVESLATERGGDVDMLSRWMSHYVAEQIVAAENATDATKAEAEERCFRTILSLWEHRSTLPNGRRPFESFEPIFESLEDQSTGPRHGLAPRVVHPDCRPVCVNLHKAGIPPARRGGRRDRGQTGDPTEGSTALFAAIRHK